MQKLERKNKNHIPYGKKNNASCDRKTRLQPLKREYNLDIVTPTVRRVLLRNNFKAKRSRKVIFLFK